MKKLNIHYFQHVTFEGLGYIEDWCMDKGHNLTSTKFYLGEQLPQIDAIDWLIVMGGPMSINDEIEYPWLIAEKLFIKEAIEVGKTIIGICLGSQLIASVLGSKVYPNTEKEIGWFPIQPAQIMNNVLFETKDDLTVFHWHGETFDLPDGSRLLASSEGCINQAFLYKKNVLGLQFHLEVTQDSLSQMISHGKDELVQGKYIQDMMTIRAQSSLINENNELIHTILNRFEAL